MGSCMNKNPLILSLCVLIAIFTISCADEPYVLPENPRFQFWIDLLSMFRGTIMALRNLH